MSKRYPEMGDTARLEGGEPEPWWKSDAPKRAGLVALCGALTGWMGFHGPGGVLNSVYVPGASPIAPVKCLVDFTAQHGAAAPQLAIEAVRQSCGLPVDLASKMVESAFSAATSIAQTGAAIATQAGPHLDTVAQVLIAQQHRHF
jgi:hypothetical protein